MMSASLRAVAVGVFVLALAPVVRGDDVASGLQGTPKPVSVAEAAPFLGEWTLAMQGPNGPGTFNLSITVEKDKVSAEIASDMLPKQPISSISLVDKSLVLGYSFTWEGNPVDAVVSLTPGKDGPMAAQIDFAGGAYVMTGTATKKEKEREKRD
jgi:hypothetical protein